MSGRMASRLTLGWFGSHSNQRVEFLKMRGPDGRGHAEMAVTKPKGLFTNTNRTILIITANFRTCLNHMSQKKIKYRSAYFY